MLKPMSKSDEPEYCEAEGCVTPGAGLDRDFVSERGGQGNVNYAKPRVSDSLAMNPEQIPEHNRLFPDIKVLADGRPTFDNVQQQDKYLKATGFHKLPQKIRNRGKRPK
ncbi:hypothetical protein LCGC14_1238160 [marine sediment metagenome]|uniref:Uncharacterized protein n=1 Tax=marine sediment metagenome TaxID=412755 RepID=A0A0F9LAP3_9ZZZZ